jgi:hypothetical protein
MIKRPCGYGGKCTTLTDVDESNDVPGLGATCIVWCELHQKHYKERSRLLTKLLPKYNKMKLKDKFDMVIKFTHHSDLSNYLFRYKKVESNRITKQAYRNITK